MNVDRKILRLALPAIVSNISVPLLGLSDIAIAGHLGSPRFLAAMGVGATMMNLSAWLFGFLRMGTAGIAANALGAQDWKGLSRLFCRVFLIAFAIGVILIMVRVPLSQFLVWVLGADAQVGFYAARYYTISVFAAPAQLAVMALSGWLVGMQSTFFPMVIAIVTNLVNIPLSLLLVFGVGCGFSGLAIGTAVAQWVGLVLAVVFCLRIWMRHGRRYGVGLLSELPRLASSQGSARFTAVNSALFLRSACVMAVSMGMTAYAASLGEIMLAANTVMMQFFTFFSFFMDGFAHAAEALIGKSAGERNGPLLLRFVKRLLLWSAGVAGFFTLVYALCGGPIVGLLTDSRSVVESVGQVNWVLILLPSLAVGAFIFDGFYIGLTRTSKMLLATVISAAFFFAFNMLDRGCLNIVWLWMAFLGYLFLRGAILGVLFRGELNRINQ